MSDNLIKLLKVKNRKTKSAVKKSHQRRKSIGSTSVISRSSHKQQLSVRFSDQDGLNDIKNLSMEIDSISSRIDYLFEDASLPKEKFSKIKSLARSPAESSKSPTKPEARITKSKRINKEKILEEHEYLKIIKETKPSKTIYIRPQHNN